MISKENAAIVEPSAEAAQVPTVEAPAAPEAAGGEVLQFPQAEGARVEAVEKMEAKSPEQIGRERLASIVEKAANVTKGIRGFASRMFAKAKSLGAKVLANVMAAPEHAAAGVKKVDDLHDAILVGARAAGEAVGSGVRRGAEAVSNRYEKIVAGATEQGEQFLAAMDVAVKTAADRISAAQEAFNEKVRELLFTRKFEQWKKAQAKADALRAQVMGTVMNPKTA